MPAKIITAMKCLLLTFLVTLSLSQSLSAVTDSIIPLPSKDFFAPVIRHLSRDFSKYSTEYTIMIIANEQRLYLLHKGIPVERHIISTSEFGLGSKIGSNKTPIGIHVITQKYGSGAELGTIFKARVNTGRIARILTEKGKRSSADNVTTRILWLSGLEKGFNKGGKVDSHHRYIYIHGTDEEGRLGVPASHGCIRMKNQAIIELYRKVPVGTLVVILP